jgi:hypothetical protein
MRSAIRLFTVLFFAISLIVASAIGALAFDPPDQSPDNVCWDPSDSPGMRANCTGNGQADPGKAKTRCDARGFLRSWGGARYLRPSLR